MTVLEPLILPADVLIVPVEELPHDLREQIGDTDGAYSITRPRTRTTSSIIDARTAALLERFRTPVTIVDAVIAYSTAEGIDPRATLDEAFGVLGGFMNDGLLVAPDSELARPIETLLAPGEQVAGFEIIAPAQVILDTEVHLARSATGEMVALKLARDGSEERMRGVFAHEATILASLDGSVTPRLLSEGDIEGQPFLAISWCSGVDVYEAASEARRLGGREGRAVLLALTEGVIGAYAHLHAQKVLHGDVHPRNVLLSGEGEVSIIDFGIATRIGAASRVGRGGIDLFMEPELARSNLAGTPPAAVSAAGEQYSLAALLYLLLSGTHTHRFALESEAMWRELAQVPPPPFASHGVDDLPAVEPVVMRGLAKQPEERYASVALMHEAFREAVATELKSASQVVCTGGASDAGALLLDDVLARVAAPDGELFASGLPAPTASLQNGGGGLAYALLRIASIREDEALLGQADLWSMRALHASTEKDAFCDEEAGIVPEICGERSFYHSLVGVHALVSLVSGALGDEHSQRLALEAFIEQADGPNEHFDVGFGRAGVLVGCALLLERLPPEIESEPLRSLGIRLSDSLAADIAAQPEIVVCQEMRSLGAAHGWAGVLFSLLRWCEASAAKPKVAISERLAQLAALAQPGGRGMHWGHSVGQAPYANPVPASWCNGAAGYVSLWTLAHRLIGEDTYARLAQGAAWSTYEDRSEVPDLCCGLAGRAYALLNLYRHGGEDAWLTRARECAERAAIGIRVAATRRDCLYKGEIGVALLVAEIEDPMHARMPLFEGDF
ncbi:MAG: lanthionine synthetase LanC family protein [Solirubrobacteraceae bacterium]